MVAEGVEVVGGVAEAEDFDGFGGDAAAGQVFAGQGAFGGAELGIEPDGGGFVEIEEFAAEAGFGGFFGRVELALGEWNAAFLGYGADSFRESQILYLADKAEDISGLTAAEAVVELAAGVDGE